MAVVIDTSIALAWILPDERSADADGVLDHVTAMGDTLAVPHLWRQETANVIVSAIRRGRLTRAQAEQCDGVLSALPVEVESHPAEASALMTTALAHDLSAYDATYLLLAERTGSTLATLDRKLASAARAAGVDVLP